MRKIFLSLLLAASTMGFAQSTFKGTLIGTDNQPVNAANVLLITLPDSTLVKGAISNPKGAFELPNPTTNSKVLIRITHLEYQELLLTPTNSNLGTITLTPATNQLSEVVVKAHRPILEQKGTRISTNVAQSTLQKLPNTSMLINFLPGVSTSYTGGGYEVFGKGNPIFFINNRRVRNLDEITQILPKDIERIELETQPGAEHDNSVGAVIYIYLKKKQGDGLSGSVENEVYVLKKGTMATTWANLNYRKGKTDWFATIGQFSNFGKKNADTYQDLQVHTLSNNWRVISDETNESNAKGMNMKIGVAHEISDKHSAGMSLKGSVEPYSGHRFSTQKTTTYQNNILTAQGLNEYDRFNQNKSVTTNAYYEGKLTPKLKLQTDIDYIYQQSDNTTDITERNLLSSASRKVHTHSSAALNWFGLKTTFLQKIGKGGLSYGGEVSSLHRNEDYTDNVLTAQDIKNTETRSAAFLSLSYPIEKVSVKLGSRYEYADFGYYENGQKSEVKSKVYHNLLPNVSVAFPWHKTQLTFSYARKIERPAFYQLSDYNTYTSPFMYQRGNPHLAPRLTDEWSALATYGPLSASVSYLSIHKGIYSDYRLSATNPDVVEKTLRNYDDFGALKCVLNFQTQIGIWMPKLTLSYGKPFASNVFAKTDGRFSVEMMNQITPTDNWIILALLTYASKGQAQELYIDKAITGVHLFAGRMFLNQALTVYGGFEDAFNGMNAHSVLQNPYITDRKSNNYSNFSFKIGVSYNFNATESKYKGQGGNTEGRF